jgi:hypothetical protein
MRAATPVNPCMLRCGTADLRVHRTPDLYLVGARFDGRREQRQIGFMPKKKEPPLSAAEQTRRFEALARETGARVRSPDDMKRIVGKIALAKPQELKRRPK